MQPKAQCQQQRTRPSKLPEEARSVFSLTILHQDTQQKKKAVIRGS